MIKSDCAKKFLSNIDFTKIEDGVLNYIESVHTNNFEYKLNSESESTIFSSIFSLYILHTINATSNIDYKKWAQYINTFQDEKTGLFFPKDFKGEKFSKTILQLTTFSLSALSILKSDPKYDLSFIDDVVYEKSIRKVLADCGTWDGLSGSGNCSMFWAIFITYKNNKSSSGKYNKFIEEWFYEHKINQNIETGWWEKDNFSKPYAGFQNGFHQLVIYDYYDKDIKYHTRIVDHLLRIQSYDGSFSPVVGGGACYDYDAVKILCYCGMRKNYRIDDIHKAFIKITKRIMSLQNIDGGFCESKNHSSSYKNLFSIDLLLHLTTPKTFSIFKYRAKATLYSLMKKNVANTPHWSSASLKWDESDLWATWFRILTLHEINNIVLNNKVSNWKYIESIGLGYGLNES
jgi:hypothetical protein